MKRILLFTVLSLSFTCSAHGGKSQQKPAKVPKASGSSTPTTTITCPDIKLRTRQQRATSKWYF